MPKTADTAKGIPKDLQQLPLLGGSAYELVIDPSATRTLYAGTVGGVYKSTNGGEDWSPINSGLGLPAPMINALAIDPMEQQTIYAGSPGGVYKSTNGGGDWSPINTGLIRAKIEHLAIDPTAPETIYAGTVDAGVYKSIDGGNNWNPINRGLISPCLTGLVVDPIEPQRLYVSTYGNGVWAYSVAPNGSLVEITVGGGGTTAASTSGGTLDVQVGYAELEVNSGDAPYGTAVFSYKQSGVIVSEAAVPASPPTTSARIFINYSSDVPALPGRREAGTIDINTGIAVVNYGYVTANITYTLRHIDGTSITTGHGTIPARAHFARFVNDLKDEVPDFDLPSDFSTTIQSASLEISSDQPLSILALRGTTNQRNDFLMTSTPISDLSVPFSDKPAYFPQFADGAGYSTSLILLNSSTSAEAGTLQIIDDKGDPLIIKQVDGAADSSFRYSIPPYGVYRFLSDGSSADLKVGWVRVISDEGTSTPTGSEILGYNPGDVLVTQTGIPSASATTRARIYVDLTGKHNTGLAIANIANTDASITVNAYEMDGNTGVGATVGPVLLNANGHTAKFADECVSALPSEFIGVLEIGSATPFAAVTLRTLVNERNEFLITSFPIADANQRAPIPIVFPEIADGGGYVTQVVLISAAGGANTTIIFYNEDGAPLAVGK